jgi:hypothetical protein
VNRSAALLLAFGLALACDPLPGSRTESPEGAPRETDPLPPRVVFRGGDGTSLDAARRALEHVFATPVGAEARERLVAGLLAEPLTIELNHRSDNFTAYRRAGRELGETITFDPDSHPIVRTERGLEPAQAETVLAHELGHAVFKLRSEQEVIDWIENPVRDRIGLPHRIAF